MRCGLFYSKIKKTSGIGLRIVISYESDVSQRIIYKEKQVL